MKSNDNRSNDYILILKSLAANLPILQSWGYVFPRLLRVIVEPGMQMRAKDALKNFIDSEHRETWSSDFRFYVTTSSGKDIVSKEKDTIFERNHEKGITTIITDNPIVDDEDGNCFFVFLDERQYLVNYSVGDIVPYPTDLGAIYTKLMTQEDGERMEEERILRAAVYFLEPYFFRNGSLFRIEELLDSVCQMCITNEEVRDTNDIPYAFLKCLFEWQTETNFSKIYDLAVGGEAEIDPDETIFYDTKNVYVTENMFKKIVEPMRAYIPINSLKRSLSDNGYLIAGKGSSTKGYTTKINISCNGKPENRIRAMKFQRDLLAVSGELNFIDLCYVAGAGGEGNE